VSAPASKVVAVPAVHVVNRGDTFAQHRRRNHVRWHKLAKANGLDASAKLKARPESHRARLEAAAAARGGAAGSGCRRAASAPPATRVTAVPCSAAKRALAQATTKVEETPAAETPVKPGGHRCTADLRWPVRGKVSPATAQDQRQVERRHQSAVPEGTPVKAAEDGVVAYSGNELKVMAIWFWFGTPTVYVTAYAMRVNCW